MKKTLVLVAIILYTTALFAQGKAMLTKDETINYINKIVRKVEDNVYFKGSNGIISNITFKTSQRGITYAYTSDGYRYNGSQSWGSGYTQDSKKMPTDKSYEFDPKYISEVALASKNADPVYYCTIKFTKANLVRQYRESIDEITHCDEVLLFFLMAENNDFEKLKKALYHLRDLCKAEDDPFGQ